MTTLNKGTIITSPIGSQRDRLGDAIDVGDDGDEKNIGKFNLEKGHMVPPMPKNKKVL